MGNLLLSGDDEEMISSSWENHWNRISVLCDLHVWWHVFRGKWASTRASWAESLWQSEPTIMLHSHWLVMRTTHNVSIFIFGGIISFLWTAVCVLSDVLLTERSEASSVSVFAAVRLRHDGVWCHNLVQVFDHMYFDGSKI